MSDKDIARILDEIYADIPYCEPSDQELEDQFNKYMGILKEYEVSLDLGYDQELIYPNRI